MRDFILALPRGESIQALTNARLIEYNNVGTATVADRTSQGALAMQLPFQEEVVDKLVPSKQSRDAYWGSLRGSYIRSLAASAAQARAGEARSARTKASFAPGMAAAQKAGVDTTVLGIKLGEPLGPLAACPTEGAGPTQTCRAGSDSFFGVLDARLAMTAGASLAPGMSEVLVRVPPATCPPWVDCKILVTTKDDYVFGISFMTRAGTDHNTVENRLSEKYRAKPDLDGVSKCKVAVRGVALGTSDTAPDRFWRLPGLTVGYIPFGSPMNCDQGFVGIRTDAWADLTRQQTDAQPKL